MNFFPVDPEMPEPEESEQNYPRWWASPDDELPALLPVSELIAVTDHVAVALVAIAVYGDGVEFRVGRHLRRGGLSATDWNELCSVFMEHMPFSTPTGTSGRLRFGVVLGDGEKVIADDLGFGGDPMAEPAGHVLSRRQQGGGGSGSSYSSADHLWLWPLPQNGPIELVMQWPDLGIDETRIMLDGTAMAALAAQAQPYWP